MANYEFRHDFMSEAVDEYSNTFFAVNWYSKQESYLFMKHEMTQKERNDWFAMYCMGGVPYPAYRARGL